MSLPADRASTGGAFPLSALTSGSPNWTSLPRQALWTKVWVGTMRARVGTPGSPANSSATGPMAP